MATRLLFIIDSLGRGGAENQLLKVASFLAGQDMEATVLQLFSGDALVPEFEKVGIRVIRLGLSPKLGRLPIAVRFVLRCVREIAPDVIWTHLPSSDIIGRITSRIANVPVISTWHSTRYSDSSIARLPLKASIGVRVYRFLERRTAGFGTRFIAVSDVVRRSYCAALGVDESVVWTIPNFLDLDTFQAVNRKPRTDGFRLIHVGRHVPEKGVEVLINAIALIPATVKVHLDLVGTGPLTGSLKDLVGRLGIADRIRFIGEVPDVARYLVESDLFILPSYREGHPVAFLEALACGLPAIGSDIQAVRDIDPKGTSTRFVPMGDASALAKEIRNLMDDSETRSRLGSKGLDIAAQFSKDTVEPRYLELLRSLNLQIEQKA